MTHKKLFPLMILFLLLLAACANSASNQEAQLSSRASSSPGTLYEEAPVEESEATSDGDFTASDTAFVLAGGENAPTVDQTTANQVERLIIRTGNLGLIVLDTEETIADITQMAEQSGGWVVSANVSQYNTDSKSGDITIRVPAAGFNSAMEALKGMAVEVQSENVSGQDVTEEYVDLEARLGNLEATAARVRTFLDDAITVEEALAVNQELSRLEGEIEVIKGRMQYLSQSAAFSTITIYLTPDIATQSLQVAGWRPQGVAKQALEALIDTLQALASILIWLAIYVLPVVLIIGVPVWLVARFIWRRWLRKAKRPEATTS
jgi:hypothetical protein